MRTTLLSAGLMIAIGSLLNWGFDESTFPNTDTQIKYTHTNLPACFGYEASCIQISANNLNNNLNVENFSTNKAKLITEETLTSENLMAQNNITENAIITDAKYELGGLISEYEAREKINNYPNQPNLPIPRIHYTN